jgi:hypothetical protein
MPRSPGGSLGLPHNLKGVGPASLRAYSIDDLRAIALLRGIPCRSDKDEMITAILAWKKSQETIVTMMKQQPGVLASVGACVVLLGGAYVFLNNLGSIVYILGVFALCCLCLCCCICSAAPDLK